MDIHEALSIMSKIELLNKYMDDLEPADIVNFVKYTVEFAGRVQIYTEHKIDKTTSDIEQIEEAQNIIMDLSTMDMSRLNQMDLLYLQRCILVHSSSIKNIICKLMILDGQSNRFIIKL